MRAGIPSCNRPRTSRAPAHRTAFTLLEVLLALALSGILIGVLAMAIRTQLRATDSGRTDVAQSQVARALLKRIGDDVRAAVWFEPIDPNAMVVPPQSSSLGGAGNTGASGPSMASGGGGGSGGGSGGGGSGGGSSGGSRSGGGGSGGGSSSSGITGTGTTSTTTTTTTTSTTTTTTTASSASTTSTTSTASGASGTSGSSGGGGGGTGGGGSGGGGGGGSSTNASVTTTQNLAQAAMYFPAPMMPVFVGTASSLQMDVSTLPRNDQVASSQGAQSGGMQSTGGALLSDMKTVSYYMTGGANTPTIMSSQTAQGRPGKGLLRQEVPRASSVGASSGAGAMSGGLGLPEPLAPEIVNIEFQYSDGVSLYPAWDSRQHNSLPKLVRITVTFLAGNMDPSSDDLNSLNPKPTVKYSLAVAPAAWRPVPAWLTAMMTSAASGGTSSSNTGTTTGGTMTGTGAF
jgi:prepilin-type N-terminal cleavage/methylation domain-containing protein